MGNFSYAKEWNSGKSSDIVSVYFFGSHLWDVSMELKALALPWWHGDELSGLWLPSGLKI